MAKRTVADIEKIRGRVDRVKRLSDRIVGVGPFGVGLDGLVTWIPVVGTVYSVGAGGFLLWSALQAKASVGTFARMLGYLAVDTTTGAVPLLGDAVDFFFPGHLMAGKALLKHIDGAHWVDGSEFQAKTAGLHDSHLNAMRTNGRKRLVYLDD